MKLKWIQFENLNSGLKIERVEFNKDVTLLVGLSGVGKTQILNAIEYSCKLAVNKAKRLQPYDVSLSFDIGDISYEWSYRIEQMKDEKVIDSKEPKYYFAFEKLKKENDDIILRDGEKVKLKGYEKVPAPKKDESLLVQYAEDKAFKHLISEISKLYPIEMDMDIRGALDRESFNMIKAKIKESMAQHPRQKFEGFSHLPVALKIYITKNYFPDLFAKIFDAIKELFVEITDIDIVEDTTREVSFVAVKVYDKILMQPEISNGMLKTIYYIVELITMSKDSVVLIDEFENGLGVNCIDILAEILLSERNDLQFIITSHHPKIINQISSKQWKIIDRDIDVVKNMNSEQYGIQHSQHDAYFNLINRWEFEGKI